MHGTYLQNKASVDRWRAKNKERLYALNRKSLQWRKVRLEFLNILMDI
jgi:hypothetical protein